MGLSRSEVVRAQVNFKLYVSGRSRVVRAWVDFESYVAELNSSRTGLSQYRVVRARAGVELYGLGPMSSRAGWILTWLDPGLAKTILAQVESSRTMST